MRNTRRSQNLTLFLTVFEIFHANIYTYAYLHCMPYVCDTSTLTSSFRMMGKARGRFQRKKILICWSNFLHVNTIFAASGIEDVGGLPKNARTKYLYFEALSGIFLWIIKQYGVLTKLPGQTPTNPGKIATTMETIRSDIHSALWKWVVDVAWDRGCNSFFNSADKNGRESRGSIPIHQN